MKHITPVPAAERKFSCTPLILQAEIPPDTELPVPIQARTILGSLDSPDPALVVILEEDSMEEAFLEDFLEMAVAAPAVVVAEAAAVVEVAAVVTAAAVVEVAAVVTAAVVAEVAAMAEVAKADSLVIVEVFHVRVATGQ